MWKAQIIDTWEMAGGDYQPMLMSLLAPGDSLMDASGEPAPVEPPHLPPVIVEMWCSQATLDAIRANNSYGPDAVLWAVEETGNAI